MSKWMNEYRCINCKHIINDGGILPELMFSDGRCPYCGHKSISACTIISTTEHAYRNVAINPWWMFWKARNKRVYLDASS